ncbi:hypothetical protein [Thalassobaculum sp.]|uniref:hypothetical protein n=1 Tax=Thalassobaculum sp. TaxID=2022740 RepID=UPI0032EEA76A
MPGDASLQVALLEALEQDLCLTPEEIADGTGIERRAVVKGVCKLIARGYAERAERGCYRLTPDGADFRASGARLTCGPAGKLSQTIRRPRKITLQDMLWRALRSSRKATLPDLLRLCDRDGGANTACGQRYLRALQLAGYVRRLPRRDRSAATAPTSNGYAIWLLVRDTGPLAPSLRRTGDIWDRNLRQSIPREATP